MAKSDKTFWTDGEVRYHEDGTIDEIVCSCSYFHLEDLGDNGLWIGVYGKNDEQLAHIRISKDKRAHIDVEIEE